MDADRLTRTLDRLGDAIQRLDRAVDDRLAREAVPAGHTDDAERLALETALAEAREGERQARQQAGELAARLDSAIDRLRLVLED